MKDRAKKAFLWNKKQEPDSSCFKEKGPAVVYGTVPVEEDVHVEVSVKVEEPEPKPKKTKAKKKK
jgi:hypothetical protein